MSDDRTTLEEWIKERYGILYNSAEIEVDAEGEPTVPLPEPHDKAQIGRAMMARLGITTAARGCFIRPLKALGCGLMMKMCALFMMVRHGLARAIHC